MVPENWLCVNERLSIPLSELDFRFSRAGGPGGQNVNKTSSRVELLFDVVHSPSMTDAQRALVLDRLASHVDDAGVLRVVAQGSPSQWQNRLEAVDRLQRLLERALRPRRRRVPTRRTQSSHERRLLRKRRHSRKKARRQSVHRGDDY